MSRPAAALVKIVVGAVTLAVTIGMWNLMLWAFPTSWRLDALSSAALGLVTGIAMLRAADRLGWVREPEAASAIFDSIRD